MSMTESTQAATIIPAKAGSQSQAAFLTRVREALTDRGEPIELPDDNELARVVRAGESVIDLFVTRCEEAKIHTHRVADEADVADKVIDLIGEVGAKSAIVPAEDIPGRDRIIDRLKEHDVTLLDPDDPDAAFTADVGITAVDAAIAETASICLTSGGPHRRLASLAVPCHIGIVRRNQILPDLLDWVARHQDPMPANEVLVSAPSKTADIELTLVMGVHGPKYEHVVIVG